MDQQDSAPSDFVLAEADMWADTVPDAALPPRAAAYVPITDVQEVDQQWQPGNQETRRAQMPGLLGVLKPRLDDSSQGLEIQAQAWVPNTTLGVLKPRLGVPKPVIPRLPG